MTEAAVADPPTPPGPATIVPRSASPEDDGAGLIGIGRDFLLLEDLRRQRRQPAEATHAGGDDVNAVGVGVPVQGGGPLRRRTHIQAQPRGRHQRFLLVLSRRAKDQEDGNLRGIQPLPLQFRQAGLPGVIDVGKGRRLAFQPQLQGLVEDEGNQQHQHGNHRDEGRRQLGLDERPVLRVIEGDQGDRRANHQENSHQQRRPSRQRQASQPSRTRKQPPRRGEQCPQRVSDHVEQSADEGAHG